MNPKSATADSKAKTKARLANSSKSLESLAAQYSASTISWHQIAADTGATFGDLLVALAKQALPLPRYSPRRDSEQTVLFNAILSQPHAGGKHFSLVVADSAPLIALGVANALDSLLTPALPVIVPDMVQHVVALDLNTPGAQAVADWIKLHEGDGLRVARTEVFEEFKLLSSIMPGTKIRNRCVQAAKDVLAEILTEQHQCALLLFEDSIVRHYAVIWPDQLLVTTTSELLFGLERAHWLSGAEEILQRATGNLHDTTLR